MFPTLSIQVLITGNNANGKLGLSKTTSQQGRSNFFTPLSAFDNIPLHMISVGWNHIVATDINGIMYAWGQTQYYQLGIPQTFPAITKPTPVQYFIDNNIQIRKAEAGQVHSIALAFDNITVYTFGSGSNGVLGRDIENTKDAVPEPVVFKDLQQGETIIDIQTRDYINYVLTSNGNVYVWGDCANGMCPSVDSSESIQYPSKLTLGFRVVKLYVGPSNVWFQSDSQEVYSIGENKFGQLCVAEQLGLNTNIPQKTIFKKFDRIETSESHTLVLIDGVVYGCGYSGPEGVLGNITYDKLNPTPIIISGEFGKIIDIAATAEGSMLMSAIRLHASGKEYYGSMAFNGSLNPSKQFIDINATHIQLENYSLTAYNDVTILYQAYRIPGGHEEEEVAEEIEESNIIEEESETKPVSPAEQIDSSLSTGAIVGIAIGSAAFVALVAVGAYFLHRCVVRKKLEHKDKAVRKIYQENEDTNVEKMNTSGIWVPEMNVV